MNILLFTFFIINIIMKTVVITIFRPSVDLSWLLYVKWSDILNTAHPIFNARFIGYLITDSVKLYNFHIHKILSILNVCSINLYKQ